MTVWEVVDLSARYTTEGVLGKGGMGEVLLAMDTRLERKVAIKRILSDGAKSQIAVKVADVIEKAHSLRGECRFKRHRTRGCKWYVGNAIFHTRRKLNDTSNSATIIKSRRSGQS